MLVHVSRKLASPKKKKKKKKKKEKAIGDYNLCRRNDLTLSCPPPEEKLPSQQRMDGHNGLGKAQILDFLALEDNVELQNDRNTHKVADTHHHPL